ncbi:hypothetical protein ACHWQZ_G007340 [Mnemiopsis leidyi]
MNSKRDKPVPDHGTPLVPRDEEEIKPNLPLTCILCFAALILGMVQALPIAILVPESVDLGLTIGQAVLIVSARPASSLIVLVLQPFMNKLNVHVYLISTGVVCFLGFGSFYLTVNCPGEYLYWAILARFVTGTTLYLINNKTVVGITNNLAGDVTTSTTLWETFFFLGIALGAASGPLMDTSVGFPLTMVITGSILLADVALLSCIFPNPPEDVIASDQGSNFKEAIGSIFSLDMVVYCWIPMIIVGGGLNYAEGITAEFYRTDYRKSLQFGGYLQLMTCVVYSVTAAVIGALRNKWPINKVMGIVVGLFGAAIFSPFVGPIQQVNPPGVSKLVLSATALNITMMLYCAIMMNSVTISALVLTGNMSAEKATSLAVNVVNVAYSVGSLVGPVIGGQLLLKFNYSTVWAAGVPFFISASIFVGIYSFVKYRKNELRLQ